jgi:hypothetical protein
MPYDSSLDECLFSKSCETETGRLTVSIYAYNKGTKKLQISRELKGSEDDFKFAKMGRLTKKEMESLLPMFQEALNSMD